MIINEIPTTKGTYLISLKLDISKTIRVGKLGKFNFHSGLYFYVGSACGPGGLRARIKRHLKINKKMHWHIDYLRDRANIEKIIYSLNGTPRECDWSRFLQTHSKYLLLINNFGASDCRCATHLFYSEKRDNYSSLHTLLKKTFPNDDIYRLEISENG